MLHTQIRDRLSYRVTEKRKERQSSCYIFNYSPQKKNLVQTALLIIMVYKSLNIHYSTLKIPAIYQIVLSRTASSHTL